MTNLFSEFVQGLNELFLDLRRLASDSERWFIEAN
jgi:hypothetical protein